MTCVVAVSEKSNGITYIGADSLGSSSSFKISRKDKKIFKVRNALNTVMGFTTSYRMGDLLQFSENLIPDAEKIVDREYMVVKFIPQIIKLFEVNGYQEIDNGQISGGTFIVAQNEKIYKIGSDYQVGENFCEYDSCGCGYMAALGSLHSTANMNMNSVDRIHMALRASQAFVPGVEAPFYIMNTKNDEVLEFLN